MDVFDRVLLVAVGVMIGVGAMLLAPRAPEPGITIDLGTPRESAPMDGQTDSESLRRLLESVD